jgi:AAA ATPase containing von Willebrand factor type A (vWA) domain
MVNTINFILILIVYTAILLLVIFYVYPFLKKLFSRKISISINVSTVEKEGKKQVVQQEKQEKTASVLGKSKFVLSQPLPNTTTNFETENRMEKEDTFADETAPEAVPETTSGVVSETEDENVNYETGEGLDVPADDEVTDDEDTSENDNAQDVDLSDEDEELDIEDDTLDTASGVDFNELTVTAKTINNPEDSSQSDEELAGRVLSRNKCTQLVKSIQDARPEYSRRITELLDMHERKMADEKNDNIEISKKKQKLYDSEEFKNFNVDDIS